MPRKVQEMATDVTEVQATENGTDSAKRERVDLEKVVAQNPNEKVTINVTVPAALKMQIVKLGEENDKSVGHQVLEILCQRFEFTLPEDFIGKRGGRAPSAEFAGMTPEEIKAHKAREAAKERAEMRAVLKLLRGGSITLTPEQQAEVEAQKVEAESKVGSRTKEEATA